MKTTIDIPDDLFREAKATAALQGISLRELVTRSLRQKLLASKNQADTPEPPWMKGFGGLAHLAAETRRIEALIDEEFEKVEPEP